MLIEKCQECQQIKTDGKQLSTYFQCGMKICIKCINEQYKNNLQIFCKICNSQHSFFLQLQDFKDNYDNNQKFQYDPQQVSLQIKYELSQSIFQMQQNLDLQMQQKIKNFQNNSQILQEQQSQNQIQNSNDSQIEQETKFNESSQYQYILNQLIIFTNKYEKQQQQVHELQQELKDSQDLILQVYNQNQILIKQINEQQQSQLQQKQNLDDKLTSIKNMVQQNQPKIDDSVLITKENFILIKSFLQKQDLKLKLIYRASQDGFLSSDFHKKCDKKGKTIIVIKSNYNEIFGGYSDISWEKNEKFIKGKGESFLFSLTKSSKHKCMKPDTEIDCNLIQWGISFGDGDLAIQDQSYSTYGSVSKLGDTYQLPNNMVYNSNEANSYLAGNEDFLTNEIEVFQIQ